jgi:hypothetical protein
MSLDYIQVSQQVKQLGARALSYQKDKQKRLAEACELLIQFDQQGEQLREKVKDVVQNHDPTLRCAMPELEGLNACFSLPGLPGEVTLIAADGSQIFHDRHAEVDYCLVNTGAIWMRYGSKEAPTTSIKSQLIYADALEDMTDERLSLQRDLAERMRLLELASEATPRVITLTDGPLELWTTTLEEGRLSGEFKKSLDIYLGVLHGLCDFNVTTAGYVDKPGADLVVRLMEVAKAGPDDLPNMRNFRPFGGITDIQLYGDVLQPGDRSAVFAIQSRSAKSYQDQLALHFFYLNVGREDHPYLARVEIPAWVADDPSMLNGLHSILVSQCKMIGARGYPYILHRAHETAVVSFEDKEQVTQMIVQELVRRGAQVGGVSAKQYNKDISGKRTRYGT